LTIYDLCFYPIVVISVYPCFFVAFCQRFIYENMDGWMAFLWAVNSNFCSRAHRLATIHFVQTTDDRQTQRSSKSATVLSQWRSQNFFTGVRSSVIVSYLQKLPYFAVSGLAYYTVMSRGPHYVLYPQSRTPSLCPSRASYFLETGKP